MGRLDGRVALVTGAASGIGAATARRLSAEGALVVVTDVEQAAGRALADEVATGSSRAYFRALDVTSESDWQDAIAWTLQEFGQLDVLVNNAGVGDGAVIEDTSLADWHRTIEIDQTGVFLGMKVSADALLASGHGSVINVSSIFGASGGFGTSPAYHAAKGAVRVLTKNAAIHWAERGIRVNSVHPGFIDTPLIEAARGTELETAMLDVTPMRRLGKAADVAAGIAYLASDDAAFVTGLELYIDGGYMAR
jgi:NAD(P)-dependent dehydrogenase (short-subunit alcohol dehydrogenase family)